MIKLKGVFDPSLLFISPQHWTSSGDRDIFLNTLDRHLTFIEKYRCISILWSDQLEALLWSDPALPPWRLDKDWNNQLVPIIYKLFSNNREIITIDASLGLSIVRPELKGWHMRKDIEDSVLHLIHELLHRNLRFYLCLQWMNHGESFKCVCPCDNSVQTPTLICEFRDWSKHIDVFDFVPSKETDVAKVDLAIDVTLWKLFGIERDVLKSKYSLDREFILALAQNPHDYEQILYAVCRRLLLTQNEAALDGGLQDEVVGAERRLRVSKEKRIHYHYNLQGEIVFRRFYGQGEHDEGL